MVDPKSFTFEKYNCENCKNRECDNFLQNFQLPEIKRSAVFFETDPICRNLKTIFEKRNSPTDKDNRSQTQIVKPIHLFEFEMSVPRKSHKCVGNHQQNDC